MVAGKPEHDLQPGDIVAGLEPGELVEVQRLAPFGSKVLVEGIGATSRRQVRRPLSPAELAVLSKVRGATRSFDGDPEAFLLGAEAERIRIAHQFDPLFAVNASIVDEDLFQKDEHVAARVREQTAADRDPRTGDRSITRARNRFFLRRLKEEMVDWDGAALFKPRHTKTVGYELTPEEKQLYDEVTSYVRSKRREARAQKNRNVELTLLVMQRRLASSLLAITRTLENRLQALNEVLAILRDSSRTAAEKKRLLAAATDPDGPRDIDEYEELSEHDRDEVDRRIFGQVLTADPEKVEQERDEVGRLCRIAVALKHHNEAKFTELLRVLDSSDVIRSEDEKLLIFTEHRDTLRSLEDRLTRRGYSVATIHGSMDIDARKQAQREFRTRAKVMVATDAAGEGINLQFCRYLINWDIPWNPNRLEQRMGRVHRYGQQGDASSGGLPRRSRTPS